MFIPAADKIEVAPLEKDSVILSETPDFIEAGRVVAIGSRIADIQDIQIGDIVHFNAYGCYHTFDKKHWVVSVNDDVILGVERPNAVQA